MTSSTDENRMIYMFYSAEAAAKFGYCIASVPDGKGGKKEIRYTGIYEDEAGKAYKWKDKQLLWSGKYSEHKWVGEDVIHKEKRRETEELRRPPGFPILPRFR